MAPTPCTGIHSRRRRSGRTGGADPGGDGDLQVSGALLGGGRLEIAPTQSVWGPGHGSVMVGVTISARPAHSVGHLISLLGL